MSEERCKVESALTSAQLAEYLGNLPATNGWAPVLAIESDGERRVFAVTWAGGTGTAPADGYVGAAGIVALIADAVDVRGAAGAAATDADAYATAAQGALAQTAVQPPDVSTVTITAGAIATPLDSNHYTLQLTEDVSAGWSAPMPSGADASTQVYWASLDILPPESGGPFALSIPGDWVQTGPLDTIALEAGDDPITVVLRTWGASKIAYCAGWATL